MTWAKTKAGAISDWNIMNRRAMPECVRAMDDFVMRCKGSLMMDILETEADEVRAAVKEYYDA
jgi:hypothetical protein